MPHQVVPLTAADLPALLDLCVAGLPLDTFSLALLRHRVFDDPRYDARLSLGIRLGRDQGLSAAVVGVIRTTPQGERHGWIKLLAVDPACRRQGLATALLHELRERFRAAGLSHIDTAGFPYYFWPGIDVRYTPACALLERLGFELRRHNVNMAVDLAGRSFDPAGEEARLAARGYVLKRADQGSLARVLDFIRREWPVWAEEVPIALTNDPVSLFYLARGEEVVGFAAYDVAMFKGTFGPMGTDAGVRGQGLGTALLNRCLDEMKGQGHLRCEIAWVGPVSFYARQAGASISRVFREYHQTMSHS